ITGIQLAKEIKKERKDIPIILCSGYSDVNLKFKSWEKNFENFLNKPVKQIELLGSIRQALDKSKLKYK
ncbi:MAG: response regulator, partial [Candidatus Aminicenantes bacterium]|nr:response regulator [Candidatus Aminicenantes bacterium]